MKQVIILLVAIAGCVAEPAASNMPDDESAATESPDGLHDTASTPRELEQLHSAMELTCFAGGGDGGCNFEQFCQCAQYCHTKSCYHYCDLAAGGQCQ